MPTKPKQAAPRRPAKPTQRTTAGAKRDAVKRPGGRERVNIMVDRELLDRVAAGFGTTNRSEAIERALRRAAESDTIFAGIDAAFGMIPDFPLDAAP